MGARRRGRQKRVLKNAGDARGGGRDAGGDVGMRAAGARGGASQDGGRDGGVGAGRGVWAGGGGGKACQDGMDGEAQRRQQGRGEAESIPLEKGEEGGEGRQFGRLVRRGGDEADDLDEQHAREITDPEERVRVAGGDRVEKPGGVGRGGGAARLSPR